MQYDSMVSVFICSTSKMVKFMYKHSWRAHLSLIDKGEGLGERKIGCWTNWPWYDKAGSCLYWDTNFAELVIEARIIWLPGPICSRTSIKKGYLFWKLILGHQNCKHMHMQTQKKKNYARLTSAINRKRKKDWPLPSAGPNTPGIPLALRPPPTTASWCMSVAEPWWRSML